LHKKSSLCPESTNSREYPPSLSGQLGVSLGVGGAVEVLLDFRLRDVLIITNLSPNFACMNDMARGNSRASHTYLGTQQTANSTSFLENYIGGM